MSDVIDYAKLESAIGLNWYEVDPDFQANMRRHLPPEVFEWAEERLRRWGEICGGPIAANAEVIDRNPPRLDQYDSWGNETGRVVHHPDALDSKRYIWEEGPHALEAQGKRVPPVLSSAFTYLLSQSDTGMVCSTGMTGGVIDLVDRYAPEGIREELMAHLMAPNYADGWDGAMFMTEIRGGSDLSTTDTVAKKLDDRRWLLNGSKWFCSNVDAKAIATLARPEGAEPGLRGLALFLVPVTRADGTPNSIHIKRIKDKLGNRSVPTAEVDFVDTEAYILSIPSECSASRGLNRMMSMVNGSRLGVGFMGLGIARRCFLEASIYAAHRTAFGRQLVELPLVQETLLQMAVEVEAGTAILFETSSLAGRSGDKRRDGSTGSWCRWPSSAPPAAAWRSPARGWRCSAATATSRTGRWPASSATPSATRSGREPRTSSAWTSCAPSPRSRPTTRCSDASTRRWPRRTARRWLPCAAPSRAAARRRSRRWACWRGCPVTCSCCTPAGSPACSPT